MQPGVLSPEADVEQRERRREEHPRQRVQAPARQDGLRQLVLGLLLKRLFVSFQEGENC